MVIPSLPMRELRLKDVKSLAWSPRVHGWPSQDSNPGPYDPEVIRSFPTHPEECPHIQEAQALLWVTTSLPMDK